MRCPYCRHDESRVIDTSHDTRGGVRRRRECEHCGQRFSTYERSVLATPLIVKQDGTREEFDHEKLSRGIRIACAKRPVPAADVDRLVGEIEATLQAMGRAEVSSRVLVLKRWTRLHISGMPLSTWVWMIYVRYAKRLIAYWRAK
jgi:transcriptional repressor NrdR